VRLSVRFATLKPQKLFQWMSPGNACLKKGSAPVQASALVSWSPSCPARPRGGKSRPVREERRVGALTRSAPCQKKSPGFLRRRGLRWIAWAHWSLRSHHQPQPGTLHLVPRLAWFVRWDRIWRESDAWHPLWIVSGKPRSARGFL